MRRLFVWGIVLSTVGYHYTWGQSTASQHTPYPFIRQELNSVHNSRRGLLNFYRQLERLEKGEVRTVNIVHIGDSHIQADWYSGELRRLLQLRFGSAGRGLVFPYKVAKTNSPISIYASSNARWQVRRNVQSNNPIPIGISGITIQTTEQQFDLKVSIADAEGIPYGFNRVKLFTDQGPHFYEWEVVSPSVSVKANHRPATSRPPEEILYHKVEVGETLSALATRYHTSVEALIRINELPSTMIYAGQELQVNEGGGEGQPRGGQVADYSFVKTFYLPYATQEIRLTARRKVSTQSMARLYGMVVENYQQSGVLYHMIGVNSARFKHYNENPGFFAQLKGLQPDLIIVSLGTNELVLPGFSEETFFPEIDHFMTELERAVPFAEVLLTTPPDVGRTRYSAHPPASMAADILCNYALAEDLAAWDFFDIMGGSGAIETWYQYGLAQADRIHLTRAGYEVEGQLLYNALMRGYGAYQAGR